MRLLEKARDARPPSMAVVKQLLDEALLVGGGAPEPEPPPSELAGETPPPERLYSAFDDYQVELGSEAGRAPAGRRLLALAQAHWKVAAAAATAVATALLLWRALAPDAEAHGRRASIETLDRRSLAAAPAAPAAPLAPPSSAAEPVAPAPEALVSLRVSSRPPGAEVVRTSDGAILGRTPLDVTLPSTDQPLSLEVRKRGYVTELVELPGDRNGQAQLELSARGRASDTSITRFPRPKTPVKDGALDPFTR
jgi:hypothetical protein